MSLKSEREEARLEALREGLREALEVHIEADESATPPALEARVRAHVLRLSSPRPSMGLRATVSVSAVAAASLLVQNPGGTTALFLLVVALGASAYGGLVREILRRTA